MAGYKGTGIVCLKKAISQAGADKEKVLLALLNEEERKVWETVLAFQWIPIEVANKFAIYGSKVLHPDKSLNDGLYAMGIERAKSDVNKVYRLIFKIVNIDTILKKATSIWKTIHQAGECTSEVIEKEGTGFYTLTNYPDFPEEVAHVTSGYIHGLLEVAGKKNVEVDVQKYGTGWRWHITFK